jgi:hypothetical protein
MDARSSGLVARSALACLAVVGVVYSSGCDQAATMPPAESVVDANTPEEHLTHVMRRLEFALEQARAAAQSGVKSQRRCSYKLLEPEKEGAPYMAKVTIETSIELDSEAVAPKTPAGRKKIEPISDDAELAEAVSTVETDVYTLRYEKQRWELVDPPYDELPDTIELCFQHALSDG